MPTIFQNKERRVIPNFRTLKKTIELKELDFNKNTIEAFPRNNLEEYLNDFKKNQTLSHAGDLISAAIVNNAFNNDAIINAAKFIYKNTKYTTQSQLELAAKVLNLKSNVPPQINIDKIDEFLEYNSLPLIHEKLKSLKLEISKFSHNPFLHCEIARLHSIIGQKKASLKHIIIAKQLASNNRYILRSFVRLMAHYDELDQAHDALRKNIITKLDPWLLASEISIASLRKKTSNLIKSGINLIDSKNFNSYSISELAATLATLELENGNRKKSLRFFYTSLLSPNDNSLAQFEWANNKQDLADVDITKFKVNNNFEARTLNSFNTQNWRETVEHAEEWFIDMPFAKRPIMFGHHAASFFLEDEKLAIKFCKAGLIANPNDPMIINNIAYSYALTNEVDKAQDFLQKIKLNDISDNTNLICLLATTGLVNYRKGLPEIGRSYYIKAITKAKESKSQFYYDLAMVHFAKEEVLVKSEVSKDILNSVMNIQSKEPEIVIMKQRIEKIVEKQEANQSV